MAECSDLPQIKNKWDELTEEEKQGFLKWGKYSIQSQENDTINVLDETNKPFSKKGLKRVIRRYFQTLNRSQMRQLTKKRKRDRKLLENEEISAPPTKQPKIRRVRGKNLRYHVQQKLKNDPDAPHIVLDCRFDHLMNHQVRNTIIHSFIYLFMYSFICY